MSDSPVIGAALPLEKLPDHLPWLRDKDRDLELQGFASPEALDGDWRALVVEAHRMLDGWSGRLGMHGPFAGLVLDARDPEARRLAAHRVGQALDVADALGARQLVLHSPYSVWQHRLLNTRIGARQEVIERVHETLGPAVQQAEALGVTLVIENIEDLDPEDRKTLVESFGSAAVALSIDTGHAQYCHTTFGAPPVDVFVGSAGVQLAHMHLQDVDGYADRHWPIGTGATPWAAVFAALAATGAAPTLLLELADPATIPASMRYLEEAGLAQ